MDGQEIGYCFSITHPGDEEYKPAVQQAQMTIPVKIRKDSSNILSLQRYRT